MGLIGWTRVRKKLANGNGNSIIPTIMVTDADRIPKNNIRTKCGRETVEETNDEELRSDVSSETIRISQSPTPPSLSIPMDQSQHQQNQTGNIDQHSPSIAYDLEAQRVIANPLSLSNGTTEGQNSGRISKKRLPVAEIATNFASILIAGLTIEALLRLIGPYQRGFFCEDDSIRLPYKTSTVPVWLLLFYCLAMTGIAFIFGEYLRLTNPKTANERISEYEKGESLRVRLLIRWVFFHGYFLIAFIVTLIFTSIAKFPVGRLRPHFIDICRPSIQNQNETEFCSILANQHRYITDFQCTSGVRSSLISEARLSFFSGHSSLAMCAAIFTSIYLHSRLIFHHVVFVPILQMFVLSSAMFIAYSRIQDHMHHWSDVLIGMTTGSSVSTFVALNIVGFQLNSRRLANQFIQLPVADENNKNGKSLATNNTVDTNI